MVFWDDGGGRTQVPRSGNDKFGRAKAKGATDAKIRHGISLVPGSWFLVPGPWSLNPGLGVFDLRWDVLGVLIGAVVRDTGSAVGGGLEVLGGFGEDERLTGELAQAGEPVVAGAGERVVVVVGGDVAGARDPGDGGEGIAGVRLEPALDDLAGLVRRAELAGDVALARAGDEADHDRGVAVDDAEIGFVFGEVAVGAVDGSVVDGAVAAGLKPRPKRAHEVGRGRRAGIEGGGEAESCHPAPGAGGFGDEYGAEDVLIEFDGQQGIELVGVAELHHVQLHGVRKRHVAVVQVLTWGADGGQGPGAGAFIL